MFDGNTYVTNILNKEVILNEDMDRLTQAVASNKNIDISDENIDKLLNIACQVGNLEFLEMILNINHYKYRTDFSARKEIQWAIRNHYNHIVRYLTSNEHLVKPFKLSAHAERAFTIAFNSDNDEIMCLSLACGVPINFTQLLDIKDALRQKSTEIVMAMARHLKQWFPEVYANSRDDIIVYCLEHGLLEQLIILNEEPKENEEFKDNQELTLIL